MVFATNFAIDLVHMYEIFQFEQQYLVQKFSHHLIRDFQRLHKVKITIWKKLVPNN